MNTFKKLSIKENKNDSNHKDKDHNILRKNQWKLAK